MNSPLHRVGWASAVVAVLATTFLLVWQLSRPPQGVAQTRAAAEKALLAGRDDEVERLAAATPATKRSSSCARRALVERGDYAERGKVAERRPRAAAPGA